MRSILVRVQQELVKASVQNRSRQQEEQTQAPSMTKEGEGGQAENSSAKKEQGEQEMQEQMKQQEVEEGLEVRREDCNAVMTKVGEYTCEESQTEEKEKLEADVKKGEADEEKEGEKDLVELEHLMKANFLMMADEVQRD